MSVIVRFPPSPTGPLHLGGARTALFNYLFAKQQSGKIYLRIEDTDRERSKPEFEQNIIESLNWLGLEFDNQEPIRQSSRAPLYQAALEKLLARGAAYLEDSVVKFKNPGQTVTFQDLIRGPITFDTRELGDFIIAKSLSEPLYHLAVVTDDLEMGITHVIRGEDHISNTPRQILLIEALAGDRPLYAHIPLILAPDRSKLSKRHGAVSVLEYRDKGYLPETLINYLALLGWNPGTNQEIFAFEELIGQFSLTKVQKSGAVFNFEKLNWFNRRYLARLPLQAVPEPARQFWPVLKERIATLGEIPELLKTEFSYFLAPPVYDKTLLKNQAPLAPLYALLQAVPRGEFRAENIKTAIMPYADREGRGQVLWPFRVALTGREKSADPFTVAAILGKVETLKRLEYAAKLV